MTLLKLSQPQSKNFCKDRYIIYFLVMFMATTYELRIYGKVQHVGFRDRIENIGRGLGISGVVYNHKDGTVRILANFDDGRNKRSI